MDIFALDSPVLAHLLSYVIGPDVKELAILLSTSRQVRSAILSNQFIWRHALLTRWRGPAVKAFIQENAQDPYALALFYQQQNLISKSFVSRFNNPSLSWNDKRDIAFGFWSEEVISSEAQLQENLQLLRLLASDRSPIVSKFVARVVTSQISAPGFAEVWDSIFLPNIIQTLNEWRDEQEVVSALHLLETACSRLHYLSGTARSGIVVQLLRCLLLTKEELLQSRRFRDRQTPRRISAIVLDFLADSRPRDVWESLRPLVTRAVEVGVLQFAQEQAAVASSSDSNLNPAEHKNEEFFSYAPIANCSQNRLRKASASPIKSFAFFPFGNQPQGLPKGKEQKEDDESALGDQQPMTHAPILGSDLKFKPNSATMHYFQSDIDDLLPYIEIQLLAIGRVAQLFDSQTIGFTDFFKQLHTRIMELFEMSDIIFPVDVLSAASWAISRLVEALGKDKLTHDINLFIDLHKAALDERAVFAPISVENPYNSSSLTINVESDYEQLAGKLVLRLSTMWAADPSVTRLRIDDLIHQLLSATEKWPNFYNLEVFAPFMHFLAQECPEKLSATAASSARVILKHLSSTRFDWAELFPELASSFPAASDDEKRRPLQCLVRNQLVVAAFGIITAVGKDIPAWILTEFLTQFEYILKELKEIITLLPSEMVSKALGVYEEEEEKDVLDARLQEVMTSMPAICDVINIVLAPQRWPDLQYTNVDAAFRSKLIPLAETLLWFSTKGVHVAARGAASNTIGTLAMYDLKLVDPHIMPSFLPTCLDRLKHLTALIDFPVKRYVQVEESGFSNFENDERERVENDEEWHMNCLAEWLEAHVTMSSPGNTSLFAMVCWTRAMRLAGRTGEAIAMISSFDGGLETINNLAALALKDAAPVLGCTAELSLSLVSNLYAPHAIETMESSLVTPLPDAARRLASQMTFGKGMLYSLSSTVAHSECVHEAVEMYGFLMFVIRSNKMTKFLEFPTEFISVLQTLQHFLHDASAEHEVDTKLAQQSHFVVMREALKLPNAKEFVRILMEAFGQI